jgi:DHA2 family multidrug resistance protein
MATWAAVISPGGMVTMAMMFVAGRLVAKIQPRYLIATGGVIIAISVYMLTNVYGDLGFWFMAHSRMLFGVGFPLSSSRSPPRPMTASRARRPAKPRP